jgi:enoyl-CoA hydratase/carnithine racemase
MSYLISAHKGRVLQLILNRPDRGNSLFPPLLVDLRRAFLSAQGDDKVHIILLTGAGEKEFCTGVDLESAKHLSPAGRVNLANVAGDVATLIYFGKPVVIAINGRSMGMGVVFAAAADYRVMVEHALFQMPEINVGVFTSASCTAIMTRVCGVAWTRRILMSGVPFQSQNAISAHLADEIVPRDQVLPRALEVAKEYGRKNPILLKAIKFAVTNALDMPYMEQLSLETSLADWYQWPDGQNQLRELERKFKLTYKLTGDADQLLEEYQRAKGV